MEAEDSTTDDVPSGIEDDEDSARTADDVPSRFSAEEDSPRTAAEEYTPSEDCGNG